MMKLSSRPIVKSELQKLIREAGMCGKEGDWDERQNNKLFY